MRHRAPTTTTSSSTTTTTSSSTTTSSGPPPARYPDTDDDSLTNPKLDTWISPYTWKQSLIEPKLPAELCIKPSGGGGGSGKKRIYKHLELRKVQVSDGYAAYFFDQTDHFMLNSFETEAKDSFKAFWNKNAAANKNDGGVDTTGLDTGFKEFKWGTKKDGAHII